MLLTFISALWLPVSHWCSVSQLYRGKKQVYRRDRWSATVYRAITAVSYRRRLTVTRQSFQPTRKFMPRLQLYDLSKYLKTVFSVSISFSTVVCRFLGATSVCYLYCHNWYSVSHLFVIIVIIMYHGWSYGSSNGGSRMWQWQVRSLGEQHAGYKTGSHTLIGCFLITF